MPQRFFTSNEYRVIQDKNIKIAKKFFCRGLNDVRLDSMDVIEEDVIIRGDLGKITIGSGTIIDSGAVLHPCLNAPYPPFDYKHLMIGSHCYIGKNTIVCARSIGNNVYIGNNCILADRVEIGSNVKIPDGSYLPPDTKVLDNSVFGGKPAKYLGEIPETFQLWINEFCSNYYLNLIITQDK